MKILVISQYYFPESFQITPICEQLVADGHDVTVLTGRPNYPSGVVPQEYKTGHKEEIICGVRVIRCFEVGRRHGPLWLALNYLSYCLSSIWKVFKLKDHYDLVFIYQLSPVLMAIPGCLYAKKHHLPLFLYCCDLWPESLKMYIQNEKNPLFLAIKYISRRIYRSADRSATQSPSFISYLEKTHGIPTDKLLYLPTFADETYLDQDFTPEQETFNFVFLGNLGIAQNLLAVLTAVEKIKDIPGFQVHFVGDGCCLQDMKTFVAEHGLTEIVVFHGRKPVEEMPKYYKLANACLVSLKADNQTGFTLPAKVQGYMAAGKPILGMIDGSAKEVIEESGCGLCVNADDIDGFANAMADFILNKEQYQNCGKNGREYFKTHFKKSIFMEHLHTEIADLVRQHTSTLNCK